MDNKNTGHDRERLTVLLNQTEIRNLKYIAVDQRVSTSELVRTAVSDFLKSKSTPADQLQEPRR
jgi:hypothetical protein